MGEGGSELYRGWVVVGWGSWRDGSELGLFKMCWG